MDIGRFASSINVHTFESSTSTPVSCAVRVGDGYSTNSLCQNIGCGGADCDAPSKYLIQPSAENLYCTKEAEAKYTIGCAPGDSYAACISTVTSGNLYQGLSGTFTKNLTFRVDGQDQTVTMICPSATPQTVENIPPSCTISLPTGSEMAFRSQETQGI